MAKTVQGTTIKIDLTDGVMVNNAKVVSADILASNGVIHVLDKVLIPAAKETPKAEETPAKTVPNTGLAGITPYLGATLAGGLAFIALKKRK